MRLGIWFWLCLKRQMKSLFFWIQLAVLPCAAVLFSGAAAQEQGVLRIALVSEEAGGRADEVISDLLSRQGSLVFYLCGSRETLVADVEARRAECGFVFQESFEKGLETGKLRRTIELVQSPSTVAGELASEAVSASVMSLVGPSGLEQLEEQSFFLDAGGQAGMMTALYEKFMTNGSTFSFVYNTTGDSQAPESQEEDGPAAQTSLYSVRGLVLCGYLPRLSSAGRPCSVMSGKESMAVCRLRSGGPARDFFCWQRRCRRHVPVCWRSGCPVNSPAGCRRRAVCLFMFSAQQRLPLF